MWTEPVTEDAKNEIIYTCHPLETRNVLAPDKNIPYNSKYEAIRSKDDSRKTHPYTSNNTTKENYGKMTHPTDESQRQRTRYVPRRNERTKRAFEKSRDIKKLS